MYTKPIHTAQLDIAPDKHSTQPEKPRMPHPRPGKHLLPSAVAERAKRAEPPVPVRPPARPPARSPAYRPARSPARPLTRFSSAVLSLTRPLDRTLITSCPYLLTYLRMHPSQNPFLHASPPLTLKYTKTQGPRAWGTHLSLPPGEKTHR